MAEAVPPRKDPWGAGSPQQPLNNARRRVFFLGKLRVFLRKWSFFEKMESFFEKVESFLRFWSNVTDLPFKQWQYTKELAFHGIFAIIYRGLGRFLFSGFIFFFKISFSKSKFSHVRNDAF